MSNISKVIDEFGYEDITQEILRTMRRSAKDIVQLGYMLKRVVEGRIWDGHYDCLDDYLRQELHMDYSMATRFIKINETYANPYDGMDISFKYQDYSQGALIEMLNMSEEQREQVTPDMTVRQIREVKKKERQPAGATATEETTAPVEVATSQDANEPEVIIEGEYRELEEKPKNTESEQLSAHGLKKTEYPDDSNIAVPGCGHKYDCFMCPMDCEMRQEERYCVETTMAAACKCTTMNVLDMLREEIGSSCQFINHELAKHREGDGEATPCCKDCDNQLCGYRCGKSRAVAKQEEEKQEVQEAPAQPDMPLLKNNDQRKAWLEDYKAWGLWYRDENIDVNYYKYDFRDGSRLIVAEYPQRQCYWSKEKRDEHHYHLLEKGKKAYGGKTYDAQYCHNTDSETYLVEFLKNLQKKGDSNGNK